MEILRRNIVRIRFLIEKIYEDVMLKRNFLLLLMVFFTTGFLSAQSEKESAHPGFSFNGINDPAMSFTGNLQVDSKLSFDEIGKQINTVRLNPQFDDKKSPWLGALFSLILPGSGEFYAERYLKAGIFFVVEAAVVTAAVIYNNKGIKATDDFQNYADNVSDNSGWSVVRYAQWLNQTYQSNIPIDPNTSKQPWERVNFNDIHAVEVQHSELSHQLAYYPEQQYYEMIGKYHQFRAGWSDYTPDLGFNVSPMFLHYTGMRATANDYFNTASKAVIGIYINHFLSAIDAYWSTTVYNKEFAASVTVENKQFADYMELVPTLNLKFSF